MLGLDDDEAKRNKEKKKPYNLVSIKRKMSLFSPRDSTHTNTNKQANNNESGGNDRTGPEYALLGGWPVVWVCVCVEQDMGGVYLYLL